MSCSCKIGVCLFNRGKDWKNCMFVINNDHPNLKDDDICPFLMEAEKQ